MHHSVYLTSSTTANCTTQENHYNCTVLRDLKKRLHMHTHFYRISKHQPLSLMPLTENDLHHLTT